MYDKNKDCKCRVVPPSSLLGYCEIFGTISSLNPPFGTSNVIFGNRGTCVGFSVPTEKNSIRLPNIGDYQITYGMITGMQPDEEFVFSLNSNKFGSIIQSVTVVRPTTFIVLPVSKTILYTSKVENEVISVTVNASMGSGNSTYNDAVLSIVRFS
ncbi:hypothetical protein ACSVDA_05490 [Cytobacillus sp. Hm23]